MRLDVRAATRIAADAETVARRMFDPTNDPSWIGGVRTAEQLTAGPVEVGTRVRRRGRFLGRPIEWVMDVVEHEPERRLAMRATRSPFPMDVTYWLGPVPGGTEAVIRVTGEARGATRCLAR